MRFSDNLFLKVLSERRNTRLEIKSDDGNQVFDKIAWGLGGGFLCIHSIFVCQQPSLFSGFCIILYVYLFIQNYQQFNKNIIHKSNNISNQNKSITSKYFLLTFFRCNFQQLYLFALSSSKKTKDIKKMLYKNSLQIYSKL